jgi:hypothetical protein
VIITSLASLEFGIGRRLVNGEHGVFNINSPNNEIIFTHKMFVGENTVGNKLMDNQRSFKDFKIVEVEGRKNAE